MGKSTKLLGMSPDAMTKYLMGDSGRFADFFNALIYGKRRLDPNTLREMDTDLSMFFKDENLLGTLKRVRDVEKLSPDGERYQILAVENQQEIHYAMAFRCPLYDMLSYCKQYSGIVARNKEEWATHAAEADEAAGGKDSFLVEFKKSDRLIPCRTVVVYYGEKKWDASRKLSELMNFASEEDRAAFQDYQYELVCLNELDMSKYTFENKGLRDFLLYVTDMYQNSGRKLSDELHNMDIEMAYIASAITGTLKTHGKEIRKQMKQGKESFDMCEAMKKALAEERQIGMERGLEQGEARGLAKGEEIGLAKGKYLQLYELIQSGTLTLEAAAASKDESVEEFQEKLRKFGIIGN